jgi:hypothetical protein
VALLIQLARRGESGETRTDNDNVDHARGFWHAV